MIESPPVHCGRWMRVSSTSDGMNPTWECATCGATETRHGICDFCSDPHPVVNEAATDFLVNPGPVGVSKGAWGACQTCHDLIAREDWMELEKRAVVAMRQKFPRSSRRDVQFAVQSMQRQFRIHRAESAARG